jgi:hypothetical protein
LFTCFICVTLFGNINDMARVDNCLSRDEEMVRAQLADSLTAPAEIEATEKVVAVVPRVPAFVVPPVVRAGAVALESPMMVEGMMGLLTTMMRMMTASCCA